MKPLTNSFKRSYWFKPLAIFLMCLLLLLFRSCQKEDLSTPALKVDTSSNVSTPLATTATYYYDIDGNRYTSVKIGSFLNKQEWMVENLRVTHFNDGTSITCVNLNTAASISSWATRTTPAYCYYGYLDANRVTYGALYNGYVVRSTKNVCPTGWRVPTFNDWTKLITYLGGNWPAGGKLKEKGYTHWIAPGSWKDSFGPATDAYGFKALPGSYRLATGLWPTSPNNLRYVGDWWADSKSSSYTAELVSMTYNTATMYTYRSNYISELRSGYSIRCVR